MATRERPSCHTGQEDLGRVNGRASDSIRAGNAAPEYGEPGNDKPDLPPRPYEKPSTGQVKKDPGGTGRQAESRRPVFDDEAYGLPEPEALEALERSRTQSDRGGSGSTAPGVKSSSLASTITREGAAVAMKDSPAAPQPGINRPETPPANSPRPGINRPEAPSATTPQPGINQPEVPPNETPQPGITQPETATSTRPGGIKR